MQFFTVLAFACSILSIYAQVCPPTEVAFLIDQSENAIKSASSDRVKFPFDYLKDAITKFLSNLAVLNAATFRVSLYGYSSNSTPSTIITQGSTPAQALNFINLISVETNAGSWTYRGLEMITIPPVYANNILIVLSSQGSGSDARRSLAQQNINRILGLNPSSNPLNWRVYVIGLQGMNTIDLSELIIVNGGKQPVLLVDRSPVDPKDPKGYKDLSSELQSVINNILCTASPTTPVPTTTARVATTERVSGLCSNCLFDGGYGFDFDPLYCDSFYQCLKDSAPIKKFCPAGTFFDGSTCDHVRNVACPQAFCAPNDNTTKYASGKCCNKYYQCSAETPWMIACPNGQAYDANTRSCFTPTDLKPYCDGIGKYVCDYNLNGPATPDCNGYSPDPYGDPCKFMFDGQSLRVAPGTTWVQQICSLSSFNGNLCMGDSNETMIFDRDGSLCSAIFLATFNGGSRQVFSPRLQRDISVYSSLQEATMTNNGVSFTNQMKDPFLYYYFFNSRQFQNPTAFRIRFRLDNDMLNVNYDIMSNSYCSLCRESVSFVVVASSTTRRVVTATFLTTMGNTVATSAIIELRNPTDLMELIVIYGDSSVYGKLYALSDGVNAYQNAEFVNTPKPSGVKIQTTRCGFQFGRGTNQRFLGLIDEFAYYENCNDIASILP
jgi:hypothetical protein